ncbi:hypothetical protein PY310_20145 [Pseudarthrobacter sp. H3Y2-7]|uniref:hypothetical protein n=1 Tax=Pseudarthrobacter naphthalenicus TaxID=3031328 RepID=UPI0023B1AA38|nr:hypothetical protein [Pseudarthrobacter sp. H3Y2-7]MDE8670885.1 hypothetical protein [Pseudarthrobacter sp. H3Y2-7]
MTDPAPRPGRPNGVLRILAVVFAVAAVGSLVLVAVDLAIGRPASGDVFIAFLNSVAAVMLWRWRSENERT